MARFGVPGDRTGGHVPPVGIPRWNRFHSNSTTRCLTGGPRRSLRRSPSTLATILSTPPRERYNARLRFAGGPLGGDFDYLRPEISYPGLPYVARRRSSSPSTPSSASSSRTTTRSFRSASATGCGGDRTLRGIPYYTVLPRTADGQYFRNSTGEFQQGGDRFWVINLEQQFVVGGPVKLVYFIDLGNTYFETQGWDFPALAPDDRYRAAGLPAHLPGAAPVHLRV